MQGLCPPLCCPDFCRWLVANQEQEGLDSHLLQTPSCLKVCVVLLLTCKRICSRKISLRILALKTSAYLHCQSREGGHASCFQCLGSSNKRWYPSPFLPKPRTLSFLEHSFELKQGPWIIDVNYFERAGAKSLAENRNIFESLILVGCSDLGQLETGPVWTQSFPPLILHLSPIKSLWITDFRAIKPQHAC